MSSSLSRGDQRAAVTAILAVFCLSASPVSAGTKVRADSPLAPDSQMILDKASRYMKSRPDKATPMVMEALSQANDIPKCLSIAAYTEPYGHPMVDVRRACVSKALALCTTRDDFLNVALKARQYECYEVTRQAINNLVGSSNSLDELYDLAHKAQEVALNDISHLAMEKAYSQVQTVEEALMFARRAKLLGMDDLVRKAIKDLIDDEKEPQELLVLLKNIEPFQIKDLNRVCLRKILDLGTTVDDFYQLCLAARRHQQKDIYEVANFRWNKLQILQKVKADRDAYQQKIDEWKQKQAGGAGQMPPPSQQSPAGF